MGGAGVKFKLDGLKLRKNYIFSEKIPKMDRRVNVNTQQVWKQN